MAKPQWLTPERRLQQARLFLKHGNKCLEGHYVCLERSHYVLVEERVAGSYANRTPTSWEAKDMTYEERSLALHRVTTPVKVKLLRVQEDVRLFDVVQEDVIQEWKADDRVVRAEERRREGASLRSGAQQKDRRAPHDGMLPVEIRHLLDRFFHTISSAGGKVI